MTGQNRSSMGGHTSIDDRSNRSLMEVSHHRFGLWSAPNPASSSWCPCSFVAPPQYTLKPSPQSAVNPKVLQCPDSLQQAFSEPCAFGPLFPAFQRLGKLDFSTNAPPLSSACACSVSSACFPHQPRAFRIHPNNLAKALVEACSHHHINGGFSNCGID
ncbi:hypothetical protein PGTUg99_018961 [Puccinia graminis f. sp. tritici]|uniref:Uncharacterized protein n=1 Tax=Puccinia graminis f. sp. tritici TaxID=56615 RepID=A0A5B0S4D9_PUCGR|nr:hypothetical protein PGTUg99_018961 [Puccinia graminis f. sp. tritici]